MNALSHLDTTYFSAILESIGVTEMGRKSFRKSFRKSLRKSFQGLKFNLFNVFWFVVSVQFGATLWLIRYICDSQGS